MARPPAPAPAAVAPLVVPTAPAPTAAPAAPARPIRDAVPAARPAAPVPAQRDVLPAGAPEKGGRRTLLPPDPSAKVGPAAIPASRLRADVPQAAAGAYAGTLARSPRFGEHPTRFRLVRFDAKNDAETVAYVYGNSAQLDAMVGTALTVNGAVYWFRETALPTVFAQEILRAAK